MRHPATPEPENDDWGRAVAAVMAHPSLWPVAARQARRLAAPGWWRRRPLLPLPDPAYVRFRLETMYGGDAPDRFEAGDLVAYLHWCRSWRRR